MLRVGLLGCGRIGRLHAGLVAQHPACRLARVHDTDARRAAAVAEATGSFAVAMAAEVIAASDVDAVLIASPTATHADYIEAAVAAGRPVFCEKPIDLDLLRVRACRERVAARNVPVQIGFNRRFDPGHRALRDALSRGEVGDLLQAFIVSRDPAPPSRDYLTAAGGMLRDMTIHDFDLARFILGDDEPVSVFAQAAPLIDPALGDELGEVDCATIVLLTRQDRQVVISNARQSTYGFDQRVEVLGTRGMLQSGNRTPHGLTRFGPGTTGASEGLQSFFAERYAEAFRLQLDSFVATATSGRAAEVGFDDGLQALLLAETAYQSLRSGRAEPVPSRSEDRRPS